MKYVARNLFLLILMGYSLTALPLNPELVTLDLSRFSTENALRNQAIQSRITYAYVLNTSQRPLVNPEKAEFFIRAEGGKKPAWTEPPELVLEIQAEGKTLRKVTGKEFSAYVMPPEGFNPYELKYTIDLSRSTLNLSGSTFTLRLSSTDPELSQLPPLEVPVQYLDKLKYHPAAAGPSAGKQMITSYFPDASGKFSVPVSREVPNSGKLFRTAVNQLLTPPAPALGLKAEVLIPRVSSIRYTSGLVNCQLADPVPPMLYTDPQLAAISLATLTDSIAAIDSPYRISKVRYGWNGAPPVPGWPTEEIALTEAPKAWLGLNVSGRHVLLVPVQAESAAPEALFAILKKGREGLIPTIPGQAVLQGTRMEGDSLILSFDAGFKGLFTGAPDQAALTLDSLTHTFTKLPQVKSLRIEEGGSRITELGGITLPEALQGTTFVNPETAFVQQ